MGLAIFPFVAMGKIIFGDVLVTYRDTWRSLVTLVAASIGHFSYSELVAVDPILGLIYFVLFVCIVSFSMVALVVAILMFAFKQTKALVQTEAGQQEIQGLSFQIQNELKRRWYR